MHQTNMVKLYGIRIAFFCGLALLPIAAVHAQDAASPAACTLAKETYHCDRGAFRQALSAAKVIGVESVPVSRMVSGQLTELVAKIGKTVAGEGAAADLTFSLLKRDLGGVIIGPSGAELATLRVYGPAHGGERGDLIWAEIYTGQPDMQWPAVAHSLIEQFRGSAGLAGKASGEKR